MRFKGLDLNLLILLDALLAETSVTGAARRLNLSQPATSSALRRLREYFGDELLISTGRIMIPTSLALSLRPIIQELLNNADAIISTSASFIPGRSDRTFRLVGSDYVFTTLIAPLIASVQPEAPNVRFETIPLEPHIIQRLERGEVDLVLAPRHFVSPNHPAILLFQEAHVLIGWNENPVFSSDLTLDVFLNLPHVAVEFGPNRTLPFAEEQMKALGIQRRIDIIAPTFAAVPWVIPFSSRVAVLQKNLAEAFAKSLPLSLAPLPFSMPVMEEMAQYHATRSRDVGLQWLIQRLHDKAVENANTVLDLTNF